MVWLLNAAGASKLAQAALIILGTFVLEDGATILSAMQVATGHLAWWIALLALYAGVICGDLGLYGLGRAAATFAWARRWMPEARVQSARSWLRPRLFQVVFISRFLPGMRLPTYTASGYMKADFGIFALSAIVATLAWTSLLFAVSLKLGAVLSRLLGAWSWAGAAGLVVAVVVVTRFLARGRGRG